MKFSRNIEATRSTSLSALAIAGTALMFFAIGCGGDTTSANGELGMMSYSLFSSYYMTSDDIREVKIVTGYPQSITISPTESGQEALGDEDESNISNLMSPSTNAVVSGDGLYPSITVSSPGSYELETLRDGKLFDKIKLQFARPASIELLTWIRTPDASDFSQVTTGDDTTAEEGTEAIFLAVPRGSDDTRLAGDFQPDRSIAPDWAAVEGENVEEVYENSIWSSSSPAIYFIEPGTVTVTYVDPISGAQGTHIFNITPVQKN